MQTSKPSGYNIFKDSLRAGRDKTASELREKEKELLNCLDKIEGNEQQMDEKFLFFKANIQNNNIQVIQEPFDNDVVEKLKSKNRFNAQMFENSDLMNEDPVQKNPGQQYEDIDNKINQFLKQQTDNIEDDNFEKENIENEDYDKFENLQQDGDLQKFNMDDVLNKFDKIQNNIVKKEQFDRDQMIQLKIIISDEIKVLKKQIEEKKAKKTQAEFKDIKKIVQEFKNQGNPLIEKKIEPLDVQMNDDSDGSQEYEDDSYINSFRKIIKPKKVEKNPKKDENLPVMMQMLQDKQAEKERIQEEKEKARQFNTSAIEEFNKQLEYEKQIQKQKEEQRQKDLAEIKRLNEEFQKRQQEKQEEEEYKIQKQLEEQREREEQLQREREEKNKQFLLEFERKQEQKRLEEQKELQQQQVQKKKQQIIDLINNFKTIQNESLYDENLSFTNAVSSINKEILEKSKNTEDYKLSKDFITARYQYICFNDFGVQKLWLQLLFFFLNNSIFNKFDDECLSFPFKMIGFVKGTYLDVFKDHIQNQIPLYIKKDIQNTELKECLYVFFDTYQGRGQEVLQNVLDIPLQKILGEPLFDKLKKKKFINDQQKNLMDLVIRIDKSLKGCNKIFENTKSFNALNSQKDQQQANILIRELVDKKWKTITQSVAQSEVQSQTEYTEQYYKDPKESLLNILIQQLNQKGLQVIGIKSIYVDDDLISEVSSFYNFKLQNKSSIITIQVSGNLTQHKVKKIIGNPDTFLARRSENQSINALYYQNKSNSILFSKGNENGKKMASYFFGGRLPEINYENIEQILDDPIQQKILFNDDYMEQLFQLNNQVNQKKTLTFSNENFTPQHYGKIFKIIEKMGIKINKVNVNSQLQLEVEGHQIKQMIDKICEKILNHDKFLSPSKKLLIDTKQNIQQTIKAQKFTKVDTLDYAMIIWPNQESIGNDLLFLNENRIEVVALGKQQFDSKLFEKLFSDSLNQSTSFKRQPLFQNFIKLQTQDVFKDEVFFAVLRLQQKYIDQEKYVKIFDHQMFINTNLSLTDNLIKLSAQQKTAQDLELVWLNLDLKQLMLLQENIQIQLFDDNSFKNSFIQYLDQSFEQFTNLIIPQELLQKLGCLGLIKRIFKYSLNILSCKYIKNMSADMNNYLTQNIIAQLKKEDEFLTQTQTYSIETFQEKQQNIALFQLQSKQSILYGKQLIKELTKIMLQFDKNLTLKYEQAKNKDEIMIEIQYQLGMYISQNSKQSEEEKNMFQDSQNVEKPQIIKDQIAIIVELENFDLQDIIEKLAQKKIIVHQFLQKEILEDHELFELSELLSNKFSQKAIFNYMKKKNYSTYALLLCDRKNASSLSDIFGSYRINDKGELTMNFKGTLLKEFKSYFIVYNEDAEGILKIRQQLFAGN